jgi:hypothetical protein
MGATVFPDSMAKTEASVLRDPTDLPVLLDPTDLPVLLGLLVTKVLLEATARPARPATPA